MKRNLVQVRVCRVNLKAKTATFEGLTNDYGRYFTEEVSFKAIQGSWKQFFQHPWQGHFYLLDTYTGRIVGKTKELILNRAFWKEWDKSMQDLEGVAISLRPQPDVTP